MIIYKTKYYGLLGDRVRQAIKESGRKSSEDREWIRRAWREVHGEVPTSRRVADIAYDDYNNRSRKVWENERAKFRVKEDELYKEKREKVDEEIKKWCDEMLKKDPNFNRYDDKYYDDYRKLQDSLYEKYNEKISSKMDELNNKFNDLVDEKQKLIDEKISKLNSMPISESNKLSNTRKLEKEWFNSELEKNIENVQKEVDEGLRLKHKGERVKIRKNPNDEKLMKSFETEFKKNGGKDLEYTNSSEDSHYNPNKNSIQTSKNPSIAFHELNHLKHWTNNTRVDKPYVFSPRYKTAEDVLSLRRYFDKEEGGANKHMFRDIFLNRKSGGRDWRAAHETSRSSNGSYQSSLGVNINKQGMQDLDYNMSPEALKKIRENAKKLGIDLNRSSKVDRTPGTPEILERIKKSKEIGNKS